jgi:hypothetical protein
LRLRILSFAAPRRAPPARVHDRGQDERSSRVAGAMEGAPADELIPAGLALLGIEADEVDLAVIAAVHGFLWPPILELLALDTSEVEPERCPDLSQAPR